MHQHPQTVRHTVYVLHTHTNYTEIENDLWFERLSGIKLVSIRAYSGRFRSFSFSLSLSCSFALNFHLITLLLSTFYRFSFVYLFSAFSSIFFLYLLLIAHTPHVVFDDVGPYHLQVLAKTNSQINWNSFSPIAPWLYSSSFFAARNEEKIGAILFAFFALFSLIYFVLYGKVHIIAL